MTSHWLAGTMLAAAVSLAATACIGSGTESGATPPSPGPARAGTPASAAKTVRIYSSLPLQGPSRNQMMSVVNGVKMALNDNGGRNGTNARLGTITVEYESLDDATAAKQSWDAAQEAANARKATEDGLTVGYIGTLHSGAARISIPIMNKAGLPMISPANVASDLTLDQAQEKTLYGAGPRNFFRVIPNESAQGKVGATWMRDLKVAKAYVVDDASLYGRSLADLFEQTARSIGLTVVGRKSAPRADSYGALAATIKASGADGVYYGGVVDENPAVLVRDIRTADPRIIFMGADGIAYDEMIQQMGPAGEGVHATFVGLSVDRYTGRQAEWAARYRATYGTDPQLYAIYGYEAAQVMLAAIKDNGGDRAKMIESVQKVGTNYEGVLGPWSFDANGDTSNTAHTGIVVQQGRWVFSKVLS